MTAKPFFSIIIPTYNRAKDLQFALFCILRQSFQDFEIVISDNCSTDNTQDMVSKLKNKKIRYFRNSQNLVLDVNQRKAVERANGKYVFFHGDDDFILYANTLDIVHKVIMKHKPGYVRVNYVSLSLDKKRVFAFKVNKPFLQNKYVPPLLNNQRALSYIIDSDHYFITGIIFKNTLPQHVRMVDADPCPWIDILFYAVKNYGAYFIAQPYIVASWSRRKIKKDAEHHLFTVASGILKTQNYFNAVKNKLDPQAFTAFLHKELMGIYVLLFPVIKMNVGNKIMLQIASIIRQLDLTMGCDFRYWLFLFISLVFPRSLLKVARDMYLYVYTLVSKVEHNDEIVRTLKGLEREYGKGRQFQF